MKSPFIVGSVIAVAIGGAIAVATALVISGCSSSPTINPSGLLEYDHAVPCQQGEAYPIPGYHKCLHAHENVCCPDGYSCSSDDFVQASPTSAAPTWGINNDTAEATGFPLR